MDVYGQLMHHGWIKKDILVVQFDMILWDNTIYVEENGPVFYFNIVCIWYH